MACMIFVLLCGIGLFSLLCAVGLGLIKMAGWVLA